MKNGTPRPIGWRAANRIVNGQDGGPGAEDLHALIAIAATSKRAGRTEAESASHEAMLTAFRESAVPPRSSGRNAAQKPARKRRTSGAVVLRFATAVLLVCGVGAAAATAGVLPEGVQRIAHDYFGIGGAPAPSTTHVPSSSAGTTGRSNANGTGTSAVAAPPMTGAGPTDSAVMITLCQQVSDHENDWQSVLDPADQATLIAAAGGEHKVKSYCSRMLSGGDKNPVPSPGPNNPTDTPTPTPTVTHGKAHVSHSPEAHSSGH